MSPGAFALRARCPAISEKFWRPLGLPFVQTNTAKLLLCGSRVGVAKDSCYYIWISFWIRPSLVSRAKPTPMLILPTEKPSLLHGEFQPASLPICTKRDFDGPGKGPKAGKEAVRIRLRNPVRFGFRDHLHRFSRKEMDIRPTKFRERHEERPTDCGSIDIAARQSGLTRITVAGQFQTRPDMLSSSICSRTVLTTAFTRILASFT